MEFAAPDDLAADVDGGVPGVGLATDEFEALLDGRDALDLRPGVEQFEALVGALVADGADDGAGHAAHDVRPVAKPADFLEDSGLVLFRNARFENDDHGFELKKNRRW